MFVIPSSYEGLIRRKYRDASIPIIITGQVRTASRVRPEVLAHGHRNTYDSGHAKGHPGRAAFLNYASYVLNPRRRRCFYVSLLVALQQNHLMVSCIDQIPFDQARLSTDGSSRCHIYSGNYCCRMQVQNKNPSDSQVLQE
jgi:hypothetical protein